MSKFNFKHNWGILKYFMLLIFLLGILSYIYLIRALAESNSMWYVNLDFKSLYSWMYNWQQLIGAFLGALTPIALFLANEKHQKKQKKKAHLLLLEKSIVLAINNLCDIDNMLHRFISNQLYVAKQRIAQETANNQYSAGQLFVPLSSTFSFSKELMDETTDSSYLENLKLDVYATSKELPLLLKDLDRQFERTISLNTQMSIAKLIEPEKQNNIFLINLTEFEKYLHSEVFGHNIPVYLRKLASTLIALKKMNELGLTKWKETFPFKPPYNEVTEEKMREYFSKEVNNQITKLQKNFKSKLFLVGEETDISKNYYI